MTTKFSTAEELKAALNLMTTKHVLSQHDEFNIRQAIKKGIEALTENKEDIEEMYLPYNGCCIDNQKFFIWEQCERVDCSFEIALNNWSEQYARAILDVLAYDEAEAKEKGYSHRAEGASEENDKLIRIAAEIVLTNYEYIKATTVV